MRRGFAIGLVLLLALAGAAIGVTAYHAGVNNGLDQAAGARVVHVVGPGYDGFPFGLFLFPLVFIGFFLLLRGAFWGRRWGGPRWGGPGASHWDRRQMFEEWHRHQHERGSSGEREPGPGPGDQPARV
jgi:hypothetical protein